MSQAFYYLHVTTTAQSAYHRSHNKFSRYFHLKVIYNIYNAIVDDWKQKLPSLLEGYDPKDIINMVETGFFF